MDGLVPSIPANSIGLRVIAATEVFAWVAGTSPAMTGDGASLK